MVTNENGSLTFTRYVLQSKWTWISLAATVAFWLYALAIGNVLEGSPSGISQNVVFQIFKNKFTYELFMDVGTAILISRIVAAFIGFEESVVRDTYFDAYLGKQKDFYDNRIKEVAQSSFRGVYQSRFPDGLISEVLEVGFGGKIVRENLNLDYKLRLAPNGGEGMIVEATAEYEMKNIGVDTVDVPISIQVPNPVSCSMKQYCRIIEYRKDYEIVDCASAIENFEALKTTDVAIIPAKLGCVKLEPNESVHIVLVYSMAKEVEDTELMRTGMPAKGLKITIHDETQGEPLWIDATAVHRCPLKDISPPNDRRVKEYRSAEYFLPNQGFIWFWKKPAANNMATTIPPEGA